MEPEAAVPQAAPQLESKRANEPHQAIRTLASGWGLDLAAQLQTAQRLQRLSSFDRLLSSPQHAFNESSSLHNARKTEYFVPAPTQQLHRLNNFVVFGLVGSCALASIFPSPFTWLMLGIFIGTATTRLLENDSGSNSSGATPSASTSHSG